MKKFIVDLSRVYEYYVSNNLTTGKNMYTLYSKTGQDLDKILKTKFELNFSQSNVLNNLLKVDMKDRIMIKLDNVFSSEVLK